MQHRIGMTLLVDHFLHLRHLSSLHLHCLLMLLILSFHLLLHLTILKLKTTLLIIKAAKIQIINLLV